MGVDDLRRELRYAWLRQLEATTDSTDTTVVLETRDTVYLANRIGDMIVHRAGKWVEPGEFEEWEECHPVLLEGGGDCRPMAVDYFARHCETGAWNPISEPSDAASATLEATLRRVWEYLEASMRGRSDYMTHLPHLEALHRQVRLALGEEETNV